MRRLLLVLVLALTGCGQAATPADPADPAGQPSWTALPDAPLSPRHGVRTAVVGDELLVLGGDTGPLCPPAASCVGPPERARDGAAYDVVRGTWSRVAPAPDDPGAGTTAVLGATTFLATPRGFWAYDRAADAWTSLPAAPDPEGRLVAAGEHLVLLKSTQEGGRVLADQRYDPATRSWSPLPRDPLAPAFDRAAVWDGERLVLLGKRVPPPPVDGVESPTVFVQAARYDLAAGRWTPVPQSDEVIGFGADYGWTGERVVSPYVFDYTAGGTNPSGTPEPTGGLLDPESGDWTPLPEDPPPGDVAVVALSPRWMTVGDGLVLDTREERWLRLDRPAGMAPEALSAAWVGDRLLVVGGGDSAARSLTSDLWSWSPG